MPKNILIISDMEFDQATYSYGWGGSASTVNETLFKTIGENLKKLDISFRDLCSGM